MSNQSCPTPDPMLTAERVREAIDYDPATGAFTNKARRQRVRAGARIGSKHWTGYLYIGLDGKQYEAHRLAWLHFYGRWPSGQVDHINGDRADNRIVNLREGSAAQNQQNIRGPKRSSGSGYLGVAAARCKAKPWQASIRAGGKRHYLGLYETQEQAHEAYLAAKRKLHAFGNL